MDRLNVSVIARNEMTKQSHPIFLFSFVRVRLLHEVYPAFSGVRNDVNEL